VKAFSIFFFLTRSVLTELERVMNIVGAAAAKIKKRLDMIYARRSDADGRKFSGLHDTLLPMASKTRSIFQQLRGSNKSKISTKRSQGSDAAGKEGSMSGKIMGVITGVDLRHLLLLLPFLLFDLLDDEIQNYNLRNGTQLVNPAHELIKFVLLLLEWYHLYR
jgi:hypothetical protein